MFKFVVLEDKQRVQLDKQLITTNLSHSIF